MAILTFAGCAGMHDAGSPPQPSFEKSSSHVAAMPGTQRQDLLYVSNGLTVTVYSYRGRYLMGVLNGFFRAGLCADRAQNIYVTDYLHFDIVGYHHGALQPFRAWGDAYGYPGGCAGDTVSANLAVVNPLGGAQYGIVLYRRHPQRIVLLTDPSVRYYDSCTYDDRGNLYIQGYTPGVGWIFAKMPRGSRTFTDIRISRRGKLSFNIAWDGHYLAIAGAGNTIYRFRISGSRGTLVSVLHFTGVKALGAFWIDGSTLVGADNATNRVLYWNYPAGGAPVASITDGISGPSAVAVSKAVPPQ